MITKDKIKENLWHSKGFHTELQQESLVLALYINIVLNKITPHSNFI